MSREEELTPLERDLAALRPEPARFDRDQLMFRAGQAAVARPRHGPRLLSAAAGAIVGAAAMLLVSVGLWTEPRVVERIVYRPAPAAAVATRVPQLPAPAVAPRPAAPLVDRPASAERPGPHRTVVSVPVDPAWSYAALRARVLEDGLPALEGRPARQRMSAGTSPLGPIRYGPLLDSLLDELAAPGSASS